MARRTRARLQMIVLLVVIGALSMSAITPARQAFSQQAMIEAEERKLRALEAENQRLRERLDRLKDPEYVEKLAREELGLVRPGEIAYVVVPGEVVTGTVTAEKPEDKPWHRRVVEWFKGLLS